jgi:hypothetical protein
MNRSRRSFRKILGLVYGLFNYSLAEISRTENKVTIKAKLFDQSGVLCLDARNRLHFDLTDGGKLSPFPAVRKMFF